MVAKRLMMVVTTSLDVGTTSVLVGSDGLIDDDGRIMVNQGRGDVG